MDNIHNNTETAVMQHDLSTMRQDMSELKGSVAKIVEAIVKLAILEDRQATQNELIDKMVTRLERLEDRCHNSALKMERIETTGGNVSNGIKAFWAVFGAAIVSAATWVFTHPTSPVTK